MSLLGLLFLTHFCCGQYLEAKYSPTSMSERFDMGDRFFYSKGGEVALRHGRLIRISNDSIYTKSDCFHVDEIDVLARLNGLTITVVGFFSLFEIAGGVAQYGISSVALLSGLPRDGDSYIAHAYVGGLSWSLGYLLKNYFKWLKTGFIGITHFNMVFSQFSIQYD